ncbi:Thioredoxin-like_fold domain-containing protein [Candidatus Hydrogenisulfobacillus filiaventi]|uniref:Thioredoxin-like_fold domain-containing protein n=1 Tax=Candidatus Hydrogenisulfobacillus filiaventi TaxID=2707344 RepID=A0A6F8ZJB0_9FIRM|nr:Thioredoxin-like_fold domain-containing protein [Candidatus Hydrogenisulfobacillus filiaventi]
MASPMVIADMIDAQEFMDLSNQYDVYGVPKSVVNGELDVTGAVPENNLLQLVMQAGGQGA